MTEQKSHLLVELARQTIEAYVREGRQIAPPADLPPEMQQPAGAFVSLHAHGELRGCIGTIHPTRPNLASEIIHNAIMAATEDPRFPPVAPHELSGLEISVDVLSEPEPVESMADLDPRQYGVIVQSGFRRGLLLPDLEGVDTVECQVDIARRKAGIGRHEPVKLSRFQVHRYH
jgi:AmmeMemoRadiSam system protein A